MASAGELLREERIKRNLTLRDIANTTRISTRYLEALESNDLATLPGEFFYKSFLKQYTSALDLDSATSKRVLSASLPTEEQDSIPLSNVYQVAEGDKGRRPGTTTAIAMLIVVLIVCSAMYAFWYKSEAPDISDKAAPAQMQPTEPAVETPPPAVAQAPAEAAGSTNIEFAANEKSWVTLSSDGKTLFAGELNASESKSFAVGSNAKLLAGNAGGVDVRYNGKPIGPLGPHGQVRVVLFSGGTFEISIPPKKSGA